MLIQKLQLKNFKRFTDLTIDLSGEKEIPKLVLLIGANGSGKSCIFDGFEVVNKLVKAKFQTSIFGLIKANDYSKDKTNFELRLDFNDSEYFQLLQNNNTSNISKSTNFDTNLFYGRTAFRYTPRINKTTIGTTTSINEDQDRPNTFADFDKRFENDLDIFIYNQLDAYTKGDIEVVKKFTTKLNSTFNNIFGLSSLISLEYNNFGLPRDGLSLEFNFKKGISDIEYKNLSAGEKMVFEILFNFVAREKTYNKDSIIFLDEIDLHLNTSLQKNLLKEINENWLGNNQVWVASHSLGFIQYTQEYERGAITDLDNLDFDIPQVLEPKQKDIDIYEIALPKEMLGKMLEGKDIYFCENKNVIIYNGLGIKNTIFVKENDKDSILLRVKNSQYFGLIDKDYMKPDEIITLKKEYPKLKVLDFYSIESYLYHPDNVAEAYPNFDIEIYKAVMLEAKNSSLVKMEIKEARKKYLYFKRKDTQFEKVEEIQDSLNSDDFNVFYPYFDVKKYLSNKPNISQDKLSSTTWFKTQIQKIINPKL